MRLPRVVVPGRRGLTRRACLVLSAALLCSGVPLVAGAPAADAAVPPNSGKVRVTVDVVRAQADDDMDPTTASDLFINGRVYDPNTGAAAVDYTSGHTDDENDVRPGWQFSAVVDDTGSVNLSVRLWDADSTSPDDAVDIAPDAGTDQLNRLVQFYDPCQLDSGATGTAGVPCQISTSSQGADGDTGSIEYRVTVEPVRDPLLRIHCTQSPLWPQPGDTVTLTAKTYDVGLQAVTPDSIEFWTDTRAENFRSPQPTAPAETVLGQSTATYSFQVPQQQGTFLYGCRARTGQSLVSTQWRQVAIGQPRASGEPIPLMAAGGQNERIDIVFMPSTSTNGTADFSSFNDPDFLADVASAIKIYYPDPVGLDVDDRPGGDMLVEFQDLFNFWLRPESATIKASCDFVVSNDNRYRFADATVLLHREDVRDCASAGKFSSNASEPDVVMHESAHIIFGEADEYCCDGGYWQSQDHANIFDTEQQCKDLTGFDSCRSWNPAKRDANHRAVRDSEGELVIDENDTWWTSDPPEDDLLVDEGALRALDVARWRWKFYQCLSANCGWDAPNSPPDITAPAPTPDLEKDPLPSFAMNAGQRSIVTTVRFNAAKDVEVVDVEVVDTPPPAPETAPMLQTILSDRSGQILHDVKMASPYFVSYEDGGGAHHYEPRPGAVGTLSFPFDPNAATLQINDVLAGNTPLLEVDVRPAIEAFCAEDPTREGCRSTDLGLSGSSVSGAPARLEVGTTASVGHTLTAANDGPGTPADATVSSTATASAGASVTPESQTTTVDDLASDSPQTVSEQFTIGCSTAGTKTYGLSSSIAPAAGTDVDQNATNNSSSSSFSVFCNRAPTVAEGRTFSLPSVVVNDTNGSGATVSSVLASGASGDGPAVADLDGDTVGIAVTALDSSNGTWEWSTDDGSSWTALAPVTESASTLLAGTARIRFVPVSDFVGDIAGGLTFRAWDGTEGSSGSTASAADNSGASAFSSTTGTVSVLVGYAVSAPTAPVPQSHWKARSTVPVKVSLVDANGTPISDADARDLAASCRVVFQASGVQTTGPECMKYSGGQFMHTWKLGRATGPETYTISVTYPGTTATTSRSETITIT